jgi:WD40 repeat protein
MTVQYSGDLQDKQVICKACDTAFDVPDNFERIRKVKRTEKGFFRKREVVEEEIVERRSDFAPPPPQSQFQQSQGQPIILNIPGAQLGPAAAASSGAGCVIGIVILVIVVGVFVAIGFMVKDESNPISQIANQVEQSIDQASSVTGLTVSNSYPTREAADRTINAHDRSVDFITFSPDGSKFVTTSSSEWVLWDTETAAQIRRVEFDAFSAEFPTFINNGEQFAIDNAGDLYFYSSVDGQQVRRLETRSGLSTISPDGTQLAYVNKRSEGNLLIMNLATQQTQTLDSLTYYVDALAYTPDGQFLLVGGRDSNFAVYTVATGERAYLGRSGFDRIDEIAFKPNSKEYVTYEREVVEFNEINDSGIPSTLKKWTIDLDFIAFTEGAVFSPDGTIIAAGDFWGGAELWDATADEPTIIERLEGERAMGTLAFSPDGTMLLTGDSNGTLYIWNLE